MNFRGKIIDPLKLWEEYCELKDEQGPFLSLTYCPNPDHPNAHTPAFQINIERPTVHCFSNCGVSGSYEHAICVIEGIYDKIGVTDEDIIRNKRKWELNEPPEVRASRVKVRRAYRLARKIIFEKSGSRGHITHNRGLANPSSKTRKATPRKTVKKSVVKKYIDPEKQLATYSYLPKEARAYLASRGIESASVARWQIGYDEDAQRLTIPVRDARGRLLFVIKRGIHKWQKPAYLYPPESEKSRVLFGACNLDRSLLDSMGLVLVEGSIDTIIQHQHGFRSTVGTLGNKLSDYQFELIARLMHGVELKRITLFFDPDAGGVTAIENARPLSQKYQVKVALYPKNANRDNLDPAKLTREQTEKALRKAISLLSLNKKLRRARKGAVLI